MTEDLDVLAAEYVLGTLSADERAQAARQLRSDPALRRAVGDWQARFSPLDETAAPERPPEGLWAAIERSIGDAGRALGTAGATRTALGDHMAQLRRRLAFWRGAAIAAGALAAALAGFVVLDSLSGPGAPAGGRYVAVVDSDTEAPAMIAEVDTISGTIRVRTLNAEAPSGHSLELWHVAEGHPPRSLGILDAAASSQVIQGDPGAGPLAGMIAVSVEPPGGSPSGAPTGPVVYSGELVPME